MSWEAGSPKNLSLSCRKLEQQRVGSSSSQAREAAVHRRLTLERLVPSTLLPECAIKPPAAEANNLPAATSRQKV